MIRINQNPLPIAFSMNITTNNDVGVWLDFLIIMRRMFKDGATQCEFPDCQLPVELIRSQLSMRHVDLFSTLTLVNAILQGLNQHNDHENNQNDIKVYISRFRSDIVKHTTQVINRASMGSILGSDETDKEYKHITAAADQAHRILDYIINLLPLDPNTVISDIINKITEGRSDRLHDIFNIIFLDQYACTTLSERHKLNRQIKVIMDYGTTLSGCLDQYNRSPVDSYEFEKIVNKGRSGSTSRDRSNAYPVHLINMAKWIKHLNSTFSEHISIDPVTKANFTYISSQHLYAAETETLKDIIDF